MRLNPEIEIELVFDDKELDLSTRQADIGIFMRRPKQLNYIQKKLVDIKYYVYGSNKYLEKFGMPKTIADLNKHKFISFEINIKERCGLRGGGWAHSGGGALKIRH